MLNKTFYAVSDNLNVFPIIVVKEIKKDDDVTAIRTKLAAPDITPETSVWHHENYLELIYISNTNGLRQRCVFETQVEAIEYAVSQIENEISSKENEIISLKAKRDALLSEVK
jgi:hypothetical protein